MQSGLKNHFLIFSIVYPFKYFFLNYANLIKKIYSRIKEILIIR